MTLRKLLLGTVAALLLAIGPAHAARECVAVHDNYETLTVHGTIVQSKTIDEYGQPYKHMAVVLDAPLCGTPSADNKRMLGVTSLSQKWLGHHVVMTAEIAFSGEDGAWLEAKHIVDDK